MAGAMPSDRYARPRSTVLPADTLVLHESLFAIAGQCWLHLEAAWRRAAPRQ